MIIESSVWSTNHCAAPRIGRGVIGATPIVA
jgi:hypothetical protein